MNVNGSTESGTQVGGARSDVTEFRVNSELGDLFNLSGTTSESREDLADVSALLHGDDSELILFVDPDEEGLGIVVENTSASGPVSVEVASFEETVTLLEKEVILN